MNIKLALTAAAIKLAHSETPMLDAEILLAHVLGQPRHYLFAYPETILSPVDIATFEQLIKRRMQHEPIAYLTGRREFWTLNLKVSNDTLIPRPETERLIETVLKFELPEANVKLADLGTGSGALALALAAERPQWEISATDISAAALQIAAHNRDELALSNVNFYQGSWCQALPQQAFDIIISNPPYIAEPEWEAIAANLQYEPQHALLSGKEGLDDLCVIIQTAKQYLKKSGYLVLEHGYSQGGAVRQLLDAEGYRGIYSVLDLAGHERITLGCH